MGTFLVFQIILGLKRNDTFFDPFPLEFESAEAGKCELASFGKIKYFVFTTHPNEYDLKYKINAPCR